MDKPISYGSVVPKVLQMINHTRQLQAHQTCMISRGLLLDYVIEIGKNMKLETIYE